MLVILLLLLPPAPAPAPAAAAAAACCLPTTYRLAFGIKDSTTGPLTEFAVVGTRSTQRLFDEL